MGGVLVGLGLACLALVQFGSDSLKKKHAGKLAVIGFILCGVGVGMATDGDDCATGYSGRGASYLDC